MKNTIKVPFKKLRRIIHLADIHIRLFKRHDEYKKCFETFYNELQNSDLSETVILVAGDLVHAKTDLSPEMVYMASEFLDSLANLAPTILITGNHDLNLANTNRLDSLTPIVKSLNNTNLHYLKYSGIYECADVDFYVYSIIGEQSNWIAPLDDSKTKIALFHGPVHNAQTDIGYTITNRHVMIETFDGFEMVLMGDIHRHQVLQQLDVINKKPIIVYSSSLIQQNHGETLHGHGWCDWDVENRSFEFKELFNDHGFYTLEPRNGEAIRWADIPENVTLRIFAGALDQSDIKKLVAQIRSKKNVIELAVSNFEGARALTHKKVDSVVDIFNVNNQNELILEYLKEAMPNISLDVLDKVIELNRVKNSELSLDDLVQKILWRPKSIKFDNLFTYGESNFIDFTTLNGIVGIFAPNASGKTSIAEAICFALYDRTPRTIKAVNIMNTRESSCYCEFIFEIDGIEYVVERKGTKNKKGEVKIDVDFYKLENGIKISLNGEERRYTNNNIRSYVGDFEDFLLTTFSSSSQQGLFVDRSNADRKDLLTQFMGLNIFDKLYSMVDSESKEIQAALKKFKKDDFTQALVDVQDEWRHWTARRDMFDVNLRTVNEELHKLTDSIQLLFEKKAPIGKVRGLEQINQDEQKQKNLEKEVNTTINELTIKSKELQDRLDQARQKLIEYESVDDEYSKFHKLKTEYAVVFNQLHSNESSLKRIKSEIIKLQEYKFDAECKFCIENGQNIIFSMEKLIKEENLLVSNIAVQTNEVRDMEVLVNATIDIVDKWNKKQTMMTWVSKAEREHSNMNVECNHQMVKMIQIQATYPILQMEKDRILEVQELIEKNKELDERIFDLEGKKFTNKKELTRLTEEMKTVTSKLAVLEQRKQDMLDKIKEAELLESQYEVYDAYLTAIHRDGLPYRMISRIIPTLELAVNTLLSQMVGFTLIFDVDGKNINIKIRYDDDKIWSLELASGMEKFITGLAIRVALTSISSLPKSSFIIIDEGLGTLDKENLASVSMLFEVLKTHFDFILLISHVDQVRDMADLLLEIKRENGFSQIQS